MLSKSLVILFFMMFAVPEVYGENQDNTRLHYYFLKATLDGQSPFAKALYEYKKKYDATNFDNPDSRTMYSFAQDMIHYNPKSPKSDTSLVNDLKTLAAATGPVAKKLLGKLSVYSLAVNYLTSGGKYGPQAYENLAMKSEKELENLKTSLVFFLSQQNAGILPADAQKGLDLLFKYYTGVSTTLSEEEIFNDPLMIPFKNAGAVEESIKVQLSKNISNLAAVGKESQNLTTILMAQIKSAEVRDQLAKASLQIQNANSFGEIDIVINSLLDIPCEGAEEKACVDSKFSTMVLADLRKDVIASEEFEAGITQAIELGLAISSLTGSDDTVGKAFQALKAAHAAYQSATQGMQAYAAASTGMGQFAALAGATTGIIGASVVVASILSSESTDSNAALLAAIEELKQLIIQLSQQVEQLQLQSKQVEALVTSYSNLISKNQSVLQQEMSALGNDIRNGIQPLKLIQISYQQNSFEQFRDLAQRSFNISYGLPSDPKTILPQDVKENLRSLFAQFSAIQLAIVNGEFKLQLPAEQSLQAHSNLVSELAAYPASRYRSALLVQNAINASSQIQCAEVNLIGYLMISEASKQISSLVSQMSHYQLNEFIKSSAFNAKAFKKELEANNKYLLSQQENVKTCLTQEFFDRFEIKQIETALQFVQSKTDLFFSDAERINDILISQQGTYGVPGGLQENTFFAGQMIQKTRSFDPYVWEKVAEPPFVYPIAVQAGTTPAQMSRKDFEALVTLPETRMAHFLGADIQYLFGFPIQQADGGTVRVHYGLPAFYFELVIASPVNQKIVWMWEGYISHPTFLSESPSGLAGAMDGYVGLAKDGLPDLFKALEDNNGLLGGIAVHQGIPAPVDASHPIAQKCGIKVGGFFDCFNRPPYTSGVFHPEIFYTYPEWAYINSSGQYISGPHHRWTMMTDLPHNTWGKEFADGFVNYIQQLKATTQSILAPCLVGLVTSASDVCSVGGFETLFADSEREQLLRENLNLIRLTLNPELTKFQQMLDLTDLYRISQIELPDSPESPDRVILQIEKFKTELEQKLKNLKAQEVEENDKVLPAEINELLESDFYWLRERLLPFLPAS